MDGTKTLLKWVISYRQNADNLYPSVHAIATLHGELADGEIPTKATNLPIRIHLFFYHSEDKLTFQSLAFTVRTTSRNIKKFDLLPTENLYILHISKVSLYNLQQPGFITEGACLLRGTTWAFKMNHVSSLNV